MKTSVEGDLGPTGPAYIELPYIVSAPLQIHQHHNMKLECLKSVLIQLCLNVSFSGEKRSPTHPVTSTTRSLSFTFLD